MEETDRKLIENRNDAVSETDTVYLLGDLTDHTLPLPETCLSRLSGHKHLIRGNHDAGMESPERLFMFFESVSDYPEIDDDGRPLRDMAETRRFRMDYDAGTRTVVIES